MHRVYREIAIFGFCTLIVCVLATAYILVHAENQTLLGGMIIVHALIAEMLKAFGVSNAVGYALPLLLIIISLATWAPTRFVIWMMDHAAPLPRVIA